MVAKILQIIPADGWFAALAVDAEPPLILIRLVSFVVLEDDGGKRGIDGLDQDLVLCLGRNSLDEKTRTWQLPHFIGFHHREDLTPQRRSELRDAAARYTKGSGAQHL